MGSCGAQEIRRLRFMFDELLTIEELEAGTRRIAADPRVRITPLGVSRLGRPIEMISLGEGDRDALVVGVPHPNEPAGAVTVERLIALLLRSERERRGYRWHFIKAIDPEGLRLNGGWLKKPRTPGNYLENFFRPALARQPETTFPLELPECRFSASTPENEAWQRAFELTRPSLHASLHHCDFGGAFYSLSRALPAALSGLEGAVKAAGLTVSEIDDEITVERWTPAVTRYATVLETTTRAKELGAAWAYPWTLGDMSPGYGEARYGALSLLAEVPLWHSEALEDFSSSGISRSEQQRELRAMADAAGEFGRRHLSRFCESDLAPDARECWWALEERLKVVPPHGPATEPGDDSILSRHEFELMHTQYALLVLRTYGLLLSLANQVLLARPQDTAAQATRQESLTVLHRELTRLEARSKLAPVPIRVMSGLQMAAIFVCADALRVARRYENGGQKVDIVPPMPT
jgi:hypothetical protein